MTIKVERLVNLTVALLEARAPMTFAELKRRTRFYDQSDLESARRMFERDKDELRRLGVPVETRSLAFGEDLGYVIDRGSYELPDVDLTPEEVAALALAVQLSGEEGARLGLAKLAARAPDPAAEVATPTTRVAVGTDPVDAVADAIVGRTPLRFTYRPVAGDERERTLDPYAVVQRRGAWYLVGRDHDRDALRAFRLDRVVGGVRTAGPPGAFDTPDEIDLAGAVAGPAATLVTVELAVVPEARWAVELRGGAPTGREHEGREIVEIEGFDPVRDISWVLGLGADVELVDPPELRAEVARRLGEVLAGAQRR